MANLEQRLNLAFAALADPTRRAIVARLCSGDATVGELAEPFEIGLPTLLKHDEKKKPASLSMSVGWSTSSGSAA